MGQPISCRRLLSFLSDTNRNFAIFRHVNPTLLRLQICISVILCTRLPGIPFRIVSQASPCTNSVIFCESRKECWDLIKPTDHDDSLKSITSRTKMWKKFYIHRVSCTRTMLSRVFRRCVIKTAGSQTCKQHVVNCKTTLMSTS